MLRRENHHSHKWLAYPFLFSFSHPTLQGCQIWRPKIRAKPGQASGRQAPSATPAQQVTPAGPRSRARECQPACWNASEDTRCWQGGQCFFWDADTCLRGPGPRPAPGQEAPHSPRSARAHPGLLLCSKSWHQVLISSTSGTVWFKSSPLQLWAARCCLSACGEAAGFTHTGLAGKGQLEKAAHLPWGKFNTSGDADTSCPSFQGCRDVDISCPSICRKVNPAPLSSSPTPRQAGRFRTHPSPFAFLFILKLVA